MKHAKPSLKSYLKQCFRTLIIVQSAIYLLAVLIFAMHGDAGLVYGLLIFIFFVPVVAAFHCLWLIPFYPIFAISHRSLSVAGTALTALSFTAGVCTANLDRIGPLLWGPPWSL